MPRWTYKSVYRRSLPHIHPPGATLFVTFRLAGSIPQAVIRQYRAQRDWIEEEVKRVQKQLQTDDSHEIAAHEERLLEFKRRWFRTFEEVLHQEKIGPVWLKENRIAEIVSEAMHYRNGNIYRLDAYCIMSNHVHAIFAPFLSEEEWQRLLQPGSQIRSDSALSNLMQSLKGYTAHEANRAIGRSGQFWEHESYDHFVRNAEEFNRIIRYVLNNPVKAGLVSNWQEWRWSYCREPSIVPQPVRLRQ